MGSFTAWASQHPYLASLVGIGIGTVLGALIILAFIGVSAIVKLREFERNVERHEKELSRGIRAFREIREAIQDHEARLSNLNRLVQTQQNDHQQLLARLFNAASAASDANKKPRRQRRRKQSAESQDAWDIINRDDPDA